ncbi:MAG TPA: hypothetical protein VHE23_05495 [Candidatus Acidoferrales bacterium]|nr:hypothetical protein [Candidatus Acidoferrales bacterium]
MHSRRIGPGTLVVLAAISLAAFEVAGFDPVSPAFAQTPAPVTLSGLFDPDLADLKTTQQLLDAIKNAHRDCYPPRVKFTVVVPGVGDPLFYNTLAGARAEALAKALPKLGLAPGQFKVDWVIGAVDGVLVSYDKFTPDDDKEAPKLKVTSIPPKGARVKAGDKIKVTIKASERYEDGHKSWPSGVHQIRLAVVGGGGELTVDGMDYARPTQPCERRTFVATFIVPRNPFPIVRLKAIAEDDVGHQDSEDAVFYTVDHWQGTYEHFYDITDQFFMHAVSREFITFDFYETSKGTGFKPAKLEGQAHVTWTQSGELVARDCAGWYHPLKTVAWDAQLTGTVRHEPNGGTIIDLRATPKLGPKVISPDYNGTSARPSYFGKCKGDTVQYAWGGFGFTLKPGQDHLDEPERENPLAKGETGQKYGKIHVEFVGK